MTAITALPAGPISPNGLFAPAAKAAGDPKRKAHSTAVDFEASFLNSMINQMFTGIDGDGPFGGGQAVGVWRSFLSEQYAKSFAKAGGIGIADQVYRTLIAQQEARSS
jgi:flagellar protein FlgJ